MDSITSKNTDIEVLSLCIGISKTSIVSQLPQDAIQRMLGKLRPENHKFFMFVKECIIRLTNEIGPEAASKNLEISLPVIKTIQKYATSKFFPSVTCPMKTKKIPKSNDLKQKVLEYYNSCKSITKTAKNFNIPKEKAISWIIGSTESFD